MALRRLRRVVGLAVDTALLVLIAFWLDARELELWVTRKEHR
jgi:hypothetical protein